MNHLSLFAPRAIVADIPPPPYDRPDHHPLFDPNFVRMHHVLLEWAAFLILFAICAAACFGLWRLFRSRSKNANTAQNAKVLANK